MAVLSRAAGQVQSLRVEEGDVVEAPADARLIAELAPDGVEAEGRHVGRHGDQKFVLFTRRQIHRSFPPDSTRL